MTRARANARLDQHEPAEAGVALLADDDVVVPSGFAAATICLVISMSARDGVGSPEG